MLHVSIIPVTAFQQNCSLVVCEATKQAAFIDPGGDIETLRAALSGSGASLEKILLTHGHLDHCSAARVLADEFNVPLIGPHIDDLFWLERLPAHSEQYGFEHWGSFTPDQWLSDNDTVSIGQVGLNVVHCPGHTPGHVVFVQPQMKLAWVGDVLFAGSIGRTDFPRGNFDDLIHSIKAKLFPLGDDIQFICGHGGMSTFGHERLTNPFVAGRAG